VTAIKRLAGQTAIYGVPTIIGRILGYLLVPLYTRVFLPDQYGTVNVFYSFASLLQIILTYGMETAFFRFSEQEKDRDKVFSTGMLSLLISSVVFLLFITFFYGSVAKWIQYPDSGNYVVWFGWIVALDAISSIPFARLRSLNRARKFATIKTVNIIINISLNLFFILLCPFLLKIFPEGFVSHMVLMVYRPDWGIEYIFISNLVASAVTLILLSPGMVVVKWRLSPELWRRMFVYAFPLLFAGMAGIINETFDRLMLRYLLPGSVDQASAQVGIYAACYKISILMTIFIQAYKYAAEPFFFAQAKEKNARETYARIMDYFIIAVSLIFLVTMLYLDDFILPILVGRDYWEGKGVIPVLLLANLFLGVYYNLSIWYKLTGKTHWGAWLSIAGAIITLTLNFWWIPLSSDHLIHGYYGSAWATFICYGTMMVLSYLIGQKFFPVKYNLLKAGQYFGLALLIYFAATLYTPATALMRLTFHTVLLGSFVLIVYFREKPVLFTRS
jgi:O-antigen/teichoic acid export membrane protein